MEEKFDYCLPDPTPCETDYREIDEEIFSSYLECPDQFVHPFSMEKSRRRREFLTYSDSQLGESLKEAHLRLLETLNPLPFSDHSYAYKKGSNTRMALLAHEGSQIFIKLDIHAFFDSITFDSFVKRIEEEKLPIEDDALASCFYQGHLPLGFICSPKLSDIYMYPFDQEVERYLEKHPEMRYSRYSDDILISSTNTDFTALRTFAYKIRDLLNEIGLTLNVRKSSEFDLSGEKPKNSSVHFLGLNLVKRKDGYEITLSKRVIHKAIDLYRKYLKKSRELEEAEKVYKHARKVAKTGNPMTAEEYASIRYECLHLGFYTSYLLDCVSSLVMYIRFNSEKSYLRFTKKFENVFHQEWRSINGENLSL